MNSLLYLPTYDLATNMDKKYIELAMNYDCDQD